MKRIFNYVWKYKLLTIVPSLAMLISIIIDMFNPYITKLMIDRVLINREKGLLVYILLGMLAITASRALLGYAKEYLFDLLSSKVHIDLKNQLFNHIESLSFNFFDNMNTGELMSRMGEDIENIWRTISFGLRLFVENAFYFVIASSILFYYNWKLAIISLLTMPPIAFLAMKLEKKIGKAYEDLSDQGAVINTTAQENIAGVRLVKAFAREKHEILKFLELNNNNYKLNMNISKIFSNFFPPMEFMTNVCVVLVVVFGGIFVIQEDLTIGTLVAFTSYINMLIWPMRMLGWLTNILSQNSASAKKIFKLLSTKPTITDENSIHLNDVKGDIEFKNVSFKYNDEYILQDVNLSAKAGSTVAIMGTTGSGKSSLISLIGRYYDVCEGEIKIDGQNIKNVNLKDLRSKMSVVFQDTFLFSESIEENIRFGKQDATMSDIEKACKAACADEFINELEEGYKTIIGERGIGLSGGQKQRLSIARALVRDSQILILDDSTSALDMETEYKLLTNLNNRDTKLTTFIIAHRISAVKNADEIIFLDNGRIIERGTHEELLKLQGNYYDVYCEQFKDFEEIENSEVI